MITKLFIIGLFAFCRGLELKQVTMLSRHNIRTPTETSLKSFTPKNWPVWNGDTGHLTPKGRALERAMGEYLSAWMTNEQLLTNDCPKDQVFVFSSIVQRTVETAKSFVDGAFRGCVEVFENTEMNVFSPIVRNNSEYFKNVAIKEMQMKLNDLKLINTFNELNKIVNFKNSSHCRNKMGCDLSEMKSEIYVKLNEVPDVLGALKIGHVLVDAFLMAYYDGFALEEVAWGQIHTSEQWKNLQTILNKYCNIRFQTKPCDRDESSTLLQYLADVFQNGTKKLYLLVGHDANILSLMSSLNFKDYDLPGQFEKAPIGGKVVFQKWYDEEKDQDLLRVQYVYQTSEQIREGAEASLHNPPQWALFEMENCAVDENGFCLWDCFMNKLNTV